MNNTNNSINANYSGKPFIGIPFTNQKYLLSINKINNNKKKEEVASIFDIISEAILEFI
jgi:hypothetical protein